MRTNHLGGVMESYCMNCDKWVVTYIDSGIKCVECKKCILKNYEFML